MSNISYLTDHYEEKIKRIKEINAPLNFVFITDMHNRLNEWSLREHPEKSPSDFELASNAIESIRYILDRYPEISCVINGGDIGNDYNHNPDEVRKSHKEVMRALYALPVPVHCCVGNHDDATGVSTDNGFDNTKFAILPEEMHKLCMKYNPTDENYYYIDFDKLGYRFVFLNTSDKPYFLDDKGQYAFGWRLEISNKQAVWFENDVLNTDKKILVFSHSPLHNEGIYGTEGTPDGIKPYDDPLYDDGIASITTLSSFAQMWSPASPERKFGTISETAFDVFSVTDDIIYMTRFGAGSDRAAHILRANKR